MTHSIFSPARLGPLTLQNHFVMCPMTRSLFLQLMHTGRVSHPLNLPAGAEVLAPSAVRLEQGQMWTDQKQLQDYPTPRAMTTSEVQTAISEYVHAAVHVLDHSSMGAPPVPQSIKTSIRNRFHGALIQSGGLDLAKAEALLDSKQADLAGFARLFLANPDLVARLEHGWPLNAPNPATFYTPGNPGYTDYPAHAA